MYIVHNKWSFNAFKKENLFFDFGVVNFKINMVMWMIVNSCWFFFFCYHFEMRELYGRVTTKYTLRRSIILLLLLFFLDFSFFFLFCYMKLEKYNFCILIFFSSFSFILQNEKKKSILLLWIFFYARRSCQW